MNIGILAVDSNYPNLALMKISSYHKARGDNVGCQHFPADGLCIMATLPDNCGIFGMPECVCSVKSFFESVEAGNDISPREFKSMSI